SRHECRASMRMARDAFGVNEVVVLQGKLYASARIELPDRYAVDFLPGRLAFKWWRRQHASACGNLFVRDQDIGPPLLEIDANSVASPQDGKVSAGGCLGTGVQNGWRIGGAALASIANRRQCVDAALDKLGRWLHVDHLG